MLSRVHAKAEQTATPTPTRGIERSSVRVSGPGDAHERAADRMADAVLQRKCTTGENAGATANGRAAPAIVDRVLQSQGAPLSTSARAFFEPRFGHDFSRVRVHQGPDATESARSVHALAYAVGNHVVVRDPSLDANSDPGRRLLAHELAHVIQQQVSTPILSRQVDGGVPQSDAGGPGTSALQAAAGSPPEVQQFLNAMSGRDPVAGVGNPHAAFAILNPLSMPRLLDVLSWLARSGFPVGHVDAFPDLNARRIQTAALAVQLRGIGAGVLPEQLASLREDLAVFSAQERAEVIAFFPAAQAPPEVVVSGSDADPPPGSPYASWPLTLRMLVVRSFRQRNVGTAGSRRNLDNAYWGGRPTGPWQALDGFGQTGRDALLANFVRSEAAGFPWNQVDSINNVWADRNRGLSFNARNPGALQAWLNTNSGPGTHFCRDSWLSGSQHSEPCWREQILNAPGLHVCVGAHAASMHIDPHQVVQGVDSDGTCSVDYTGRAGRQHGRDEGFIPSWVPLIGSD